MSLNRRFITMELSLKEKIISLIHSTTGNIFSRKRSILFISVHKCATSYFSRYVLHQIKGRTNINFPQWHFRNAIDPDRFKIMTRKYGYVYGVIRLLDKEHPSYALTERLLCDASLREKKIAILVRDPRDILVSMYYSFGFSHPGSPNEEIWTFQDNRCKTIRRMTIDEYVLQEAQRLNEKFDRLHALRGNGVSKESMVFKYEDLINKYDEFYNRLGPFIELEEHVKDELYKKTRPPAEEQPEKHKRKGIPGDYKLKLEKQTIQELNKILEPALLRFGYLENCPPLPERKV